MLYLLTTSLMHILMVYDTVCKSQQQRLNAIQIPHLVISSYQTLLPPFVSDLLPLSAGHEKHEIIGMQTGIP